MESSSIDASEAFWFTHATIVKCGVALLALGFALSITFYIVLRLHVGVDVSDSAYYIISYAQHREIESQSTLAGWVWASISPFHGVLANRYLNVFFLIVCFALLALETRRTSADRSIGPTIAIAFSTAGSLVYYTYWLPDPSYNSMNLGFIALGWAGLFGLLHATSNKATIRPSETAWAFVVGVAVMSDFLTKPTSAVLLGPTLLISYLANCWRYLCLRRVLLLALSAFFGLAFPFIALVSIGETPVRAFTTLENGVDAAFKIAAPQLNPLHPFLDYVGSTVFAPIFKQWFTWIAVIVVTTASSDTLSSRLRLTPLMRLYLNIGVAIGFPLLVWYTDLFVEPDRGINGLLVLMIALAVRGILLVPRDRRLFLSFVVGALAISPVIYAFGTGNVWGFLIPTASGFACAALGIIVASLPKSTQPFVAIPGLGLLATLLGSAVNGIEWQPYRISAPLSALHSPAHVGPLNELFLESPDQATFYNKLASIRPIVEQLSQRPYLIDLSGSVPMVTFQIGAKAPRTPWLLSGYSGSAEVFDLMVGKLPQEDLRHAWVFQIDDYNRHFPDEILQKYGLNFPADYLPLATVPIQYLGLEGTLYAPAAAVKDIDLRKLKR